MGPVKLQFAGHRRRSPSATTPAKRIVVDAAGADEKGRGQAAMLVTAQLVPAAGGTKVEVDPGPAAVRRGRAVRPGHDLGRHRRADARLRDEHAEPHRRPSSAATSPAQIGDVRRPPAASRIGVRAALHGAEAGVPPVLPALPAAARAEEASMVLWWIGNVVLLLVVVPVLVALLNRVLAALERIRGASDDILAGGVGADRRARRACPSCWPRPTRPSTRSQSARSATPAPSPSCCG